jgi:hypothetical protein
MNTIDETSKAALVRKIDRFDLRLQIVSIFGSGFIVVFGFLSF